MEKKPYYECEGESSYVKRVLTLDDHPKVKGYNFEEMFDFNKFIDSYFNTGFQATRLKVAVDIIKKMRKEKAFITLGFTSNMITSGIREIITYLTKNKLIDMIVTPVGGIEEDLIKTLKPFVIGKQRVPGATLLENGINRTGNIFVPNDRYTYFEKTFVPFLEKIYKKQLELQRPLSGEEFFKEMGFSIDNKESFLYWASKHNIPVFCPALTDGAIGDLIYFFKNKYPKFLIDICQDMKRLVDITMNLEKSGLIILGAGVVKHHILNANSFREGADYTVLINTSQEFDGSDSGADPEESVSWCKLKPESQYVKLNCDATIAFPLIAKAAFVDYKPKK